VIQVNISGTHRDPRVYEMPEQFQADRHLRHPLKAPGYIPFGGGPRVCLGRPLAELEVRLLAVRLLQILQFTLTPGQDLSLETIPTPRPRDGLLVAVKRRGACVRRPQARARHLGSPRAPQRRPGPFVAITPLQPGIWAAAICIGQRVPWEPERAELGFEEPAPTPGGTGMASAGAVAQMKTVREAMTSSETVWLHRPWGWRNLLGNTMAFMVEVRRVVMVNRMNMG